MAATPVTLVGNLVADPEVAETKTGRTYARFRLGVNERYRDARGEWQEHEAVFWQCEAWGDAAIALRENARKGAPMIVTGPVRYQSWTTESGEMKGRLYVKVDAIGPNWATHRRRSADEGAAATGAAAEDWADES